MITQAAGLVQTIKHKLGGDLELVGKRICRGGSRTLCFREQGREDGQPSQGHGFSTWTTWSWMKEVKNPLLHSPSRRLTRPPGRHHEEGRELQGGAHLRNRQGAEAGASSRVAKTWEGVEAVSAWLEDAAK